MSADLSGAFPYRIAWQISLGNTSPCVESRETEIARLSSALAQVIERLQAEVARLERELRVERAITRHDAEVLALRPEHEEEQR